MRTIYKAFTLIELLVVIAIIALLAAILFPVFASAKVRALQATNVSNHKQIFTAMSQYQNDNNDYYPLAWTIVDGKQADAVATNDTVSIYAWQNVIQPYIKNWRVMIDPISPFRNDKPGESYDPFLNYGIPSRSEAVGLANWQDSWYAPTKQPVKFQGLLGLADDDAQDLYNIWIYDPITANTNSFSSTEIASPAETVSGSDAAMADWWLGVMGHIVANNVFGKCLHWSAYPSTGASPGPIARYVVDDKNMCTTNKQTKGLITTQFSDGHVKPLQIKAFFVTAINSKGDRVYRYLWPTESF